MLKLSDKFHEEYSRIQQQFDEWAPFEQLYASAELTKKLQLSYRYFLSQLLFQTNNHQENNDMFNHTIHQANTPAILACLLSDPLDKIITTLQLYLPLLSTTTTNEKLLDSYRDVFIYLDSKLNNLSNFSYNEQQLINLCQQIKFFIQTNPSLQKFLVNIPQLTALASSTTMINKGNTEENSLSSSPPKPHQPLQRYPSVRPYQHTPTPPAPLMNFSSEGSHTSSLCQQLIHKETNDSGVDLSETDLTNSVQNFLSSHNSQHTIIGRSHSANLTLTNEHDNQHNHQFVVKTTSSPTPEQTVTNRPSLVPLSGVLSAPIHSYYSDLRHQNSNYQQQQRIKPTLTVSDEDDQELQSEQNFLDNNNTQITPTSIDVFLSNMNTIDNRKHLCHFRSLRTKDTRNNQNSAINNNDGVSPYLCVDTNPGSVRNTFIQPNSGMRDVPKWLKNLRLHKYAFFFSQMTYNQMMNLTIEQLKEGKITDGACTKILLNIKKLKERQILLQQCLIDIDNGQIDIKTVLQQLHELMLTPIRSKQIEQNNNNDNDDEDLPKLIMQVLEKVYQQLTSNTSTTNMFSDMCNNLVGLFDRCYKHEAFSANQRHTLLHWRGPLCNKLQTSGKIEFKSMQSSSSSSINRRTQLRPQTSMGNMNTTQITKPAVRNIKSTLSYYSNYQSSSTPLSRQLNSEIQNTNGNNNNTNTNSIESNIIRRPTKSPTLVFTTNDDSNEDIKTISSHQLSIVSSHSLQEQSSYHQTTPFISERSGNGSGNLRPSFNYLTSTPQRNNGAYLSTNQHQLLTRKTSIDPYGETNTNNKTKLYKTFSDPSKIRFYNPTQTTNLQSPSSSIHSQISSQQPIYRMMSTPYSQQQQQQQPRQYLSHSQTNGNNKFDSSIINQSPIQKSYSDKEASIYYGNENNNTPTSSSSSNNCNIIHDVKNVYNQRHNSTEFESLCRQMTESAICDDDVNDLLINNKEELTNIQNKNSLSNSSTDTQQ